jgi:hypothetical protein
VPRAPVNHGTAAFFFAPSEPHHTIVARVRDVHHGATDLLTKRKFSG